MGRKSAQPDARIAEIAARQHGVVSISQLRTAGLGEAGVLNRHRAGRLHRIHRGVYAVGHRGLSIEARWMAAILAIGDGAAISHRSAAELWGLLPIAPGPIHVSLAARGGRAKRQGIRLHRRKALTSEMRTRRRGIPVTTPARTISDLRRSVSSSASPPPVSRSGSPGSVSPSELRQAIRRAEVLGLPIDEQPGADRTRSELERRFLRLCRRSGLPRPEVNAPVAGLTVDFLWRERGLIVETDGYRYHRGRIAFEEDRARDLRLRSRGLEVIRLTYRQVADEPEEVVLLLSSLLRTQRP